MFTYESNKDATLLNVSFNDKKIGEIEKLGGKWIWRIFTDCGAFIKNTGKCEQMHLARESLQKNYKPK
jgi:hypothetical protein